MPTNLTDVYRIDYQVLGVKDINESLKTIKGIDEVVKALNTELIKTERGTAQYQDLAKAVALLKNEQNALKGQQKDLQKSLVETPVIATGSYKELSNQLVKLRAEFRLLSEQERNGGIGKALLAQIQPLDKQLKKIDAELGLFQRNVGNYGNAITNALSQISPQLGNIAQNLQGVFSKAGGEVGATTSSLALFNIAAIGVGVAVAGIGKALEINAKISDLKAAVARTAELTTEQINTLVDSLKQLDTRTSLEDLLKISLAAGKLGVTGKENVLQFTKAIDVLAVSLGDEFQGGAEEVSNRIGKLSTVFFGAEKNGTVLANNILHIGNALNVLADRGNASADGITELASRIGKVGVPLGLTQGYVLGLSATLDELNISAEVGGTSIGKLLGAITGDRAKFAKVLGLDLKEFTNLLNTDMNAALTLVIKRIGALGKTNTDLSDILKAVGVDGQNNIQTLLALGKNQDLLTASVEAGTKALLNQDSVNKEFKTQNETLGASLDKLKKAFIEAFVSSGVEDALKSMLNAAIPFVKALFAAVGAVIDLGKLLTGVAFFEYAEQQRKINSSQTIFTKLLNDTSANLQEQTDRTSKYFDVLKNNKSTQYERIAAINELKRLAPETLKNLNLEKLSTDELTAAYKLVNAELKENAVQKLKVAKADAEAKLLENKTLLARLATEKGNQATGLGAAATQFKTANDTQRAKEEIAALEDVIKNTDAKILSIQAKTADIKKETGNANLETGAQAKEKERAARKEIATAFKLSEELEEIEKIKVKAIAKIRDDADKAKAEAIEDQTAREIEKEISRSKAVVLELQKRGETELETRKNALQKLKTDPSANKTELIALENAFEKAKLDIQKDANAQIEVEQLEHERRIEDIKKAGDKRDKAEQKKRNTQLIADQKSNFAVLQDLQKESFVQIDQQSADNLKALAEKKQNELIDAGSIKSDKKRVKVERLIEFNYTVANFDEEQRALQAKLKEIETRIESAKLLNIASFDAGFDITIAQSDLEKLAQESEKIQKQITDSNKKEINARSKEQKSANKEEIDEAKKKRKFLEDAAYRSAETLANGIASLKQTSLDAEKEAALRLVDEEYVAKLEAAKGNAVETEKLQKEINARKKEIEIKAIQDNAKLAKSQALIAASLAIIQTLASPAIPFPASLVAAGLVGLKTGFEIANINAQADKQIAALRAEKGAIIPISTNARVVSGEEIQGARHSGGGVDLIANGQRINAEGGEYIDRDENGNVVILSRRITKRFKPFLETMPKIAFSGKGRILKDMLQSENSKFSSLPSFTNAMTYKAAEGGFFPQQAPNNIIQVVSTANISDAQIEYLAKRLASVSGQAVKQGVVEGVQEGNRINERTANAVINSTL